jgi:CheY-like chemotaxis protein
VEDHKMNQLVARRTLEKHFPNVNLTIANHGGEAVEILETTQFDLILMDIQMPVMDGNETTEHIRTKMPHIKTPILAMTAHAYISKDNAFKAYGFDDFVLKPFELEDFFTKMHKYSGKNFENL